MSLSLNLWTHLTKGLFNLEEGKKKTKQNSEQTPLLPPTNNYYLEPKKHQFSLAQ